MDITLNLSQIASLLSVAIKQASGDFKALLNKDSSIAND